MRHKNLSAYFTVEATIILVTTLYVIVFIIYLMFYQYDRCILDQDLGIVSIRGTAYETGDENKRIEYVDLVRNKLDSQRYVACDINSLYEKSTMGKLYIGEKIAIEFPFSFFIEYGLNSNWSYERQFISDIYIPEYWIKQYKRIKTYIGD